MNIFEKVRAQADAIIQERNDQHWIEREHHDFLLHTDAIKQTDTNIKPSVLQPANTSGDIV